MLTFPQWLKAQRDRTDAVGTLARDAWEDYRHMNRRHTGPASPRALRFRIRDAEPFDGTPALAALDRVEEEWLAYMALHKRSAQW